MSLNNRITKLEEKVAHLEDLNAPRKQEVKTDNPENNSTDEGEGAVGKTTVAPKIGPTPKSKNESKRRWYNSHEWWKNKPFSWWKDRLEFAALFAGIAYAIVTYLQWKDLKRNFVIDQRPYVWIDRVVAKQVVSGQPITVDVYFTNYGKAPARKLATFVHVAFGKTLNQLCENRNLSEYSANGFSVLGAGKSDIWKTAISVADPTASQSTIINWTGERPVAVYGSMTYIDGVDLPYKSTFCVELLEGSNIPMFVEGENNLQ